MQIVENKFEFVNSLIEGVNKISIKCAKKVYNNLNDLINIENDLDTLIKNNLQTKVNESINSMKDNEE